MKPFVLALVIALLGLGQLFTPALAAPAELTCGDTYVVQRGDYLTKIARNCGITYSALLAANPEITTPSRIFPGQVIRIKGDVSIPVTGGGTYTVVSGDTLFKISVRFGTTVSTLLKLNPGITNASRIFVGQVINLPSTSTGARVSLSSRSVKASGTVTVTVAGFPASTDIDYRIGKQNAAYTSVVDGKTNSSGGASATITLPSTANAGELWTITVLTTSLAKGTSVTSSTITIAQ